MLSRYITTATAQSDPSTICDTSVDMGEFGVYDLDVDDDGGCVITEALAPVNANLALLVAFLVIVVAWILWWAVNRWINILTRNLYGNKYYLSKGGQVAQ